MRVILVRPNSKLRSTTLPLGMGYVADAVRKAGHEVSILDARLERLSTEAAADRVLEARPDVVGISAIHFEKHETRQLAKVIREKSEKISLVVGGPLVSTSGPELVEEGTVDAAIMAEGEVSFPAYLEAISENRSLDDVPGLIYRSDNCVKVNPPPGFIEDLDGRIPAWDLIDPCKYFRRFGRSTLNMLRRSSRTASIFTSRGCPFGCIYCHNLFGKKFRARSPESVLSEIAMLQNDYGIEEIEIIDDAFNINLGRAKAIARGIIANNRALHITFPNGLRADRMDEELIDLLVEAGTYRISYAIETASPRLQKLIHKNLDLDRTEEIITHTADRGIFTMGYFMLGFPTETEEEVRMTMDFALRSKCHASSIFYVTPFVGTQMAEKFPLKESHKKALDNIDFTALTVNLSEVPDETLHRLSKQMYRKFHFAPDRMWRTFKVVPKNFRTLWSVLVVAALSVRDIGNF